MGKIFKIIGDGSVCFLGKTYDSGTFFVSFCVIALVIAGIILLSFYA